ncbi:MAG: hypothetical protein ACRCUT_03250, partial [Spirochaetota bacterium]
MSGLLTQTNNIVEEKLGKRFKTAQELQDYIQNPENGENAVLLLNAVESAAPQGLCDDQKKAFETSYGVAQGERAGTIVAGNGGYYNPDTGTKVA